MPREYEVDQKRLISLARGQAPVDLLIRDVQILNVLVDEIRTDSVAVLEGPVATVHNSACHFHT